MYTQCSKCETVYRLTAEALGGAGGKVRCGRCGEVFDALSRLAEDANGFTRGESPLFLETRAEEILETREPQDQDAVHATTHPATSAANDAAIVAGNDLPPGVELAELTFLHPIDDELAAETSLEFTLPADDLDRIFVESRTSVPQLNPVAGVDVSNSAREQLIAALTPDATPSVTHGAATTGPLTAMPVTATPATAVPVGAIPLTSATARSAHGKTVSPLLPRAVPRGRMVPVQQAAPEPPATRRRALLAWLAAAVALGALLTWQLLHDNPDWLAEHVPLFATSASPRAALSAYQLRQWGVTGDPGARGTLRVRASIMNSAAQLQPYPLLRVALVNRFGTRVGSREFEPAEYLGHAPARLLSPGERLDAALDIVDPGKDAEGFELDVCVAGRDRKIVCAGDLAAQPK